VRVAVPREQQLAVDRDIEDAVRAFDKLRLYAYSLLDLGRQTDSPGQVVSGYAVGDGDLHGLGKE
jgi:hypothetical protein